MSQYTQLNSKAKDPADLNDRQKIELIYTNLTNPPKPQPPLFQKLSDGPAPNATSPTSPVPPEKDLLDLDTTVKPPPPEKDWLDLDLDTDDASKPPPLEKIPSVEAPKTPKTPAAPVKPPLLEKLVASEAIIKGGPKSPLSPLSPRMISAIEKERILEAKTPPPEKDEAPRPVIKAPTVMRRTRVIIKTVVVEDDQLPTVIPHILSFVDDEATLRTCLHVNKIFMAAAVNYLYQTVSLFGSNGPVLQKIIKLMASSAEGNTMADYRAPVRSLEIGDIVLDEPEVTPLQSWNLVRELIRRLAPNLERLYLDSDDERFHDPDFIQSGSCGLDQRVNFPRLKSLSIAPGCLAFPDGFIFDLLRRCPPNSLTSIRFPGCITAMTGTGYFLIAERAGKSLRDLIITPPSSFPPPSTLDPAEFDPEDEESWDQGRRHYLGPYDPSSTWDPDLFADGLLLMSTSTPNLRALDISGHTTGLRPGSLEALLRGCPDIEELDLPCGVTDATLYELLTVKPKQLWRLNVACNCHRQHTDPVTIHNAATAVPCSFLTDGVVRAVLDEIMAGKAGALIELPTHVMVVKSARMLPTLQVLEEVPGAKIDMMDTDSVYIPRIGVKAVVPNGRLLIA
ncbi:hypothetical protein HDU76_005131 [Blyttiomyces sp. JEL0837]|nr:hypothetical protein HDU76_005131 [Blyttiomyces sp. JEL0837]